MTVPARGYTTLLIPRPLEFGVKTPLIVGAFVVGHLSTALDDGASWVALLISVVAFELCFYQGRYMLNDLIERDLDRLHPAARSRARLSGLDTLPSRVLLGYVILRVGAGLAIALSLPSRERALVLCSIAAASLAASIYEYLRHKVRSHRPNLITSKPHVIHLAIYTAVGLGYGIRINLGVGLAGGERPTVAIPAVLFGWAFGVMFVTMTWTLEATCLSRSSGDGGLARRKTHVVALRFYTRVASRFEPSTRVLLPRPAANAPWSWATILASAIAGWLGSQLVGIVELPKSMLLAAIALATGLTLVRSRLVGPWTFFSTLGGVSAVVLTASVGGSERPWLAAVPLLALLATHAVFRCLRAVDIGLVPANPTSA